ncbi:5'-nucleotidase [Powellomyces hirtus]|uniref:5'-nucleotidase n=1 Tax=Powellomyces hirtus TaxID=109895 RepID=A0A507E5G5_9FUNG|nr:5'-nucleotidase [Powellomyces hirtus]
MTTNASPSPDSDTEDMERPSADSIMRYIANPDNSIYVKDSVRVTEKLTSIIADGKDSLHIISDFDMTISKYWVNGERNIGSHRVLALSSRVTEEFTEKTTAIYKKYYPIEISQTVPYAEKVKAMVEWWSTAHEMILELKLTKEELNSMADEVDVVLRDGVVELVAMSEELGIPLLVFSAGLGDVIEAILRKQNLLKSNVEIVSNKLHFGPDKIADRFMGKIIHTFNKDEAVVEGPYAKMIEGRANVILMGDSLGDLRMGQGLKHDTQLTIGFLNHDQELLIEQYSEAFDIVVLDDASMDICNLILEAVSK